MKIKELLDKLSITLEKDDMSSKARCKRIDSLMGKLEKKENKLTKKLGNETDKKKRKRLKTELKKISLQTKKAKERRAELNKS